MQSGALCTLRGARGAVHGATKALGHPRLVVWSLCDGVRVHQVGGSPGRMERLATVSIYGQEWEYE
eukprot:COSAG01_NODE_752_length_13837_cov_76.381670_2_plen_66_part_00